VVVKPAGSTEITSFRDLQAYQQARSASRRIVVRTRAFPKVETYALTDQIRRSSRAVFAILAEAWGRRRYPRSFASKLTEALAEANETQAWLDAAFDADLIDAAEHRDMDHEWQQIGGRIQRMIGKKNAFCRSAQGHAERN
jgi:four helix bundle protein